jgi:hypothetical protein
MTARKTKTPAELAELLTAERAYDEVLILKVPRAFKDHLRKLAKASKSGLSVEARAIFAKGLTK